jgi:hypothetical protein
MELEDHAAQGQLQKLEDYTSGPIPVAKRLVLAGLSSKTEGLIQGQPPQ